MDRIGIYGGAFNPPHAGHIAAAKYAVSSLNLSRLLVIPTCVSPHKPQPADSATPQQRLQMLQIAFAREEKIEISDLEICRGEVSYTYETVEQVKKQYPGSDKSQPAPWCGQCRNFGGRDGRAWCSLLFRNNPALAVPPLW